MQERNTADLSVMFDSIDADGNGALSVRELRRGLRTNPAFARLAGGQERMSVLAAGLVAERLLRAFDQELGDGDGLVSREEFVVLCRKLVQQQAAARAEPPSSAKPSRARAPAAAAPVIKPKPKLLFGSMFRKPSQPEAEVARAEAQLEAVRRTLHTEVVPTLSSLQAQARECSASRQQRDGLCLGISSAIDACRRLQGGPEELATGSAPAALCAEADVDLELEVLDLRRLLSEAKVALAESESANGELRRTLVRGSRKPFFSF